LTDWTRFPFSAREVLRPVSTDELRLARAVDPDIFDGVVVGLGARQNRWFGRLGLTSRQCWPSHRRTC